MQVDIFTFNTSAPFCHFCLPPLFRKKTTSLSIIIWPKAQTGSGLLTIEMLQWFLWISAEMYLVTGTSMKQQRVSTTWVSAATSPVFLGQEFGLGQTMQPLCVVLWAACNYFPAPICFWEGVCWTSPHPVLSQSYTFSHPVSGKGAPKWRSGSADPQVADIQVNFQAEQCFYHGCVAPSPGFAGSPGSPGISLPPGLNQTQSSKSDFMWVSAAD